MRIERAVNYVRTLGPGLRLCIWVNGCLRGCPGCVSQRLQQPDDSTDVDIYEYFAGYNLDKIDGVTVSGGEPFEQPEELSRLVEYLVRRGVRDILVYTGYTLSELKAQKNDSIDSILGKIAVLIDGPYVMEMDTGKGNLKGSDNQCIHYLIPEYRELYEAYMNDLRSPDEVILANTLLSVGIPDRQYIDDFKRK